MTNKSHSADQLIESGILATRVRKYPEALVVFGEVYSGPKEQDAAGRSKYVEGLSFYGLCLAKEQRKYKAAIDLCKKAIELQFYNADHYTNMARVYLESGSRRRAIEVIQQGRTALPNDRALIELQQEIGQRRRPVIPFLSRDHPLNIALGKARHARVKKKEAEQERNRWR